MPAKLWSGCSLPSLQGELSPSLLCTPFRAQLPVWLGVPSQRGMRNSTSHCRGTVPSTPQLAPLLGHMIVPGMAESTKHLYNLSLFFMTFSELQGVLIALHPVLHYGFEHLLQLSSFLGHIFRGSQHTIRPLQIQMHTHFPRKGPQPSLPS